jgi:hypothetical protein
MRKDDHGEFVHHPKTARFYDDDKPEVVLLETRCEECGHILDSEIILKTEDEVQDD